MSYHRTAKLKVHNPSGYKLRRLKRIQRRYTQFYVDVLRRFDDEDTLRALTELTATNLKKRVRGEIPDGATGAVKSGLIEDIAQGLQTYFDTPDANYPAPSDKQAQPTGELLDALTSEMTIEEENELKWALRRKSETYTRPIQFARFRDAPILKSKDGEKMWVAIKTPKAEKKTHFPDCDTLRPIRGKTDWSGKRASRKWLLLPIETSRWHMYRFFDKGTPKTAKITIEDDEVYVHYAFAFDDPEDRTFQSVVGIDRGRAITAAYAAVRPEGSVIEDGSSIKHDLRRRLKEIDRQIADDQAAGRDPGDRWAKRRRLVQHSLHHIANEIVRLADENDAVIALEDLSNISGAPGGQFNKGLKRSQYQRVAELVEEKAEERGLWPVEVHPAYTSSTCPECGTRDLDSRESRDTFRCTNCGHDAHADLNAARMIAIRALWNLNGGKKTSESLMTYTEGLSTSRSQGQTVELPAFN